MFVYPPFAGPPALTEPCPYAQLSTRNLLCQNPAAKRDDRLPEKLLYPRLAACAYVQIDVSAHQVTAPGSDCRALSQAHALGAPGDAKPCRICVAAPERMNLARSTTYLRDRGPRPLFPFVMADVTWPLMSSDTTRSPTVCWHLTLLQLTPATSATTRDCFGICCTTDSMYMLYERQCVVNKYLSVKSLSSLTLLGIKARIHRKIRRNPSMLPQ